MLVYCLVFPIGNSLRIVYWMDTLCILRRRDLTDIHCGNMARYIANTICSHGRNPGLPNALLSCLQTDRQNGRNDRTRRSTRQ